MSVQDILEDKEKVRIISQAAFDSIDINKTGFLERKDVEALLINIAKDLNVKKPSKDEVDDVMKELDPDKDGKVRPDEFQVLVEEILGSMAQTLGHDPNLPK